MFGNNALELIRELNQNPDSLPAFNDEKFRQVLEEMQSLFEENQLDVAATVNGKDGLFPSLRWEFGSVLPSNIKSNFSEAEVQWFLQYNRMLAQYMQSIGEGRGLDLTRHLKPPKSLYIKVRCVADYGELETEDGTTVVLKKDTQHFLRRSQCEHLIRQGILEHVL
ncbi:DNA replication complex GINS protein PSF1 [Chamberlinius hualienensis]